MSEEAHLPAPTRQLAVHRIDTGQQATSNTDTLAVETPVALVFNGISHAVMMATPADLEAFGLGFALSEGVIDSAAECYGIEAITTNAGCEVRMEISARASSQLKSSRRQLAGPTGCGVCGMDSLQTLDLHPPHRNAQAWVETLSIDTVLKAMAQLPTRQPLNALTGAVHAAGWATPQGELTRAMEDVGRHNALDKLFGARAQSKTAFDDGFVVMSSRASYELVRKCARLGVPLLATISAPTTLAVDLAQRSGVHLYGFCRGDQAVRYAP